MHCERSLWSYCQEFRVILLSKVYVWRTNGHYFQLMNLSWSEYLGKQASHITKHGWGVRNEEKLLNIDWNKILLGVIFFKPAGLCTCPHTWASKIFALDKFSCFLKDKNDFFSLSKKVENSLISEGSTDYFSPFSLAWFAIVQRKYFCGKIKHDEWGKTYIIWQCISSRQILHQIHVFKQ